MVQPLKKRLKLGQNIFLNSALVIAGWQRMHPHMDYYALDSESVRSRLGSFARMTGRCSVWRHWRSKYFVWQKVIRRWWFWTKGVGCSMRGKRWSTSGSGGPWCWFELYGGLGQDLWRGRVFWGNFGGIGAARRGKSWRLKMSNQFFNRMDGWMPLSEGGDVLSGHWGGAGSRLLAHVEGRWSGTLAHSLAEWTGMQGRDSSSWTRRSSSTFSKGGMRARTWTRIPRC